MKRSIFSNAPESPKKSLKIVDTAIIEFCFEDVQFDVSHTLGDLFQMFKTRMMQKRPKLLYVNGGLNDVPKRGNKILAHVLDNSGRWCTNRGTMGVLTKLYDKEPEDLYNSSTPKPGKIQYTRLEVDSSILLCNLIAQYFKTKGEPSKFSYHNFERCLIKLRHLAETEQMTSKEHIVVHFARVHFSVPRLKWDRVEQMINKELVEHGVDVIVYSRDRNDAHRFSQNK